MNLLATIRERRSVGRLAEELEEAQARSRVLGDAAAALVACVKALALDIDELGSAELKAALDATLARLMSAHKPKELEEDVRVRKRETLAFAEKERRYLDDRDGELRRIIRVLTDGLAEVGHGNSSHDRIILDKGARIEAASQLGDIVKLREVISREVQGLRRAVADKQARDRAHTAALTGEVERLRRDVDHARAAAETDPLTGAANRRAFDRELARLCELAGAGGEGFALLLVDVDHFKSINDTHGHPVGDRVLMGLVGFCRESIRKGDLIARWGGEEFAIVLPSASLRIGARKATALVKDLAKRTWSVGTDGATLAFTVSIGATAWRTGDEPEALVERVDGALYAAKEGGRNRVVKR